MTNEELNTELYKKLSACRKRSLKGGLFLVKSCRIWYNKYG